MRKSFLIPMICLCTVHFMCKGCQHASLPSSLAQYPLVLLLLLTHAAKSVSAQSLHAGGACVAGITRHPQFAVICAAGLVLTSPRVRSAIGMSGSALVGVCLRMTQWLCGQFRAFFLGDVAEGVTQANATLQIHTQQLNSIQESAREIQKQLDGVSADVHGVQEQLGALTGEVGALHTRADETYDVMKDVKTAGQQHGTELGLVHARCEAMDTLLQDCRTQLSQLNGLFTAHDATFDERVQRLIAVIHDKIMGNEGALNALKEQLAIMQQKIDVQVGETNRRLGHIETMQQQQHDRTINAFNEGLQQLLQQGNNRRQSVYRPITNIPVLDKQLAMKS